MNPNSPFARLIMPLTGPPPNRRRPPARPVEWPLRPSSVRSKPIAKPEPTTRPTLKP
jgi:hypothetical protein